MTSERNVDNASSDERSPLLGKTATPLPKLQVLILIITQLTEEMSATVIFPFIEQVEGFGSFSIHNALLKAYPDDNRAWDSRR